MRKADPAGASLYRQRVKLQEGIIPLLYGTGETAPGKQAFAPSLGTQAMWMGRRKLYDSFIVGGNDLGEELKCLMSSTLQRDPQWPRGPTGWATVFRCLGF